MTTDDSQPDIALDESRFRWSRGAFPRTTAFGGTRIDAEVVDTAVVFKTRVLRLAADRSPAMTLALANLIAALNRRLRFACVAIAGREIVLEAREPVATLNSARVNDSVEALAVCAGLAKGACAALASEDVAQWYLAFHKPQIERRAEHADADA